MPHETTGTRKPSSRTSKPREKLKLKEILVPTDFSPASKKALEYATKFAAQFSGSITVINVIEPLPASDEGMMPKVLSRGRDLQETHQALESFARRITSPDLLKATHVLAGKPFEEIINSAKNLKTDIIIIATHGYPEKADAILGSTAERVVRFAPCPVLTVRNKQPGSTPK